MEKKLQNQQIARFALSAQYEAIGQANIDQLKWYARTAAAAYMR